MQAFHADRSLVDEDSYLCTEREKVAPLLNDIMTYKFKRHSKTYTTQNSDSGVEDECSGCLSLYCVSCIDAQNEALKDIEDLNQRLAAVEALFPSSHALAELYPLYSSREFTARVKAISLWYNMTKLMRLKLVTLGRLLENKISKKDDFSKYSSSPSDSNNSNSSVNDCLFETSSCLDSSSVNFSPVGMLLRIKNATPDNVSPYRKYMENILKTRTLHKSLDFLDKLQLYVLRKAQVTLLKPDSDEVYTKNESLLNEEDELQRYGCWSPEAKTLNLPSYRANFLFLAAIPLEMIHEFLKMRLEQKPAKPSPLSVRQLMRELKEGLKVATVQKEKIETFIKSAVSGTKETEYARIKLEDFDKCMLEVFNDYLDYLEQWALLDHETFQKNLLEEEWYFACDLIEYIPGGAIVLGEKFSFILASILKNVSHRLSERIEEVLGSMPKEDKNMIKLVLMS